MWYRTRFRNKMNNKRHSSVMRNHAHNKNISKSIENEKMLKGKIFHLQKPESEYIFRLLKVHRVEKFLMLRKQGEIILLYM
jgi:hypothetical protein